VARRRRSKPKSNGHEKINPRGLVVDLTEVLLRSVTKAEMVLIAKLLRPAWVDVLSAKEGRRWRLKLTSSRCRLHA
jgi:hypothetical protein